MVGVHSLPRSQGTNAAFTSLRPHQMIAAHLGRRGEERECRYLAGAPIGTR